MSYATNPGWVYIFLLFGLMPALIASLIFARRASGVLPLTEAAHKRFGRPTWIGLGLLGGTVLAWILSGLASSDTLSPILFLVGLPMLLAGLVVLILRRSFGLRASVIDVVTGPGPRTERAVVLGRVHPAFAAAVEGMNRYRSEQYAQQVAGWAASQPAAPTVSVYSAPVASPAPEVQGEGPYFPPPPAWRP